VTAWLRPGARSADDTLTGHDGEPSPPRRGTILHRLEAARRANADTPHLAGLADRPMPLAPADRS
jgi:hypothetical protein